MGLGAVELWVRGKAFYTTAFGFGPRTAVGRKMLSSGIGCCLLPGLGKKQKLNSGWALGPQ